MKMLTGSKNNKSHTRVIDIEKLLNLDLPETCYFLGFFWGDGNLRDKTNSLNIEIIKKDMDNLWNIFSFFGKWTVYSRHRKGKQPSTRISFSNIDYFNFLKNNGYDNKENPHNICKILPEENIKYFLLGLIDADGCFYYNQKLKLRQFTLSSSYNQDWGQICNILDKINCKYNIKRRIQGKNKSSILLICDKKSIKNLGDFIFNNKLKSLDRKIDKFKLMFE